MGRFLNTHEETQVATDLERLRILDDLFFALQTRRDFVAIEKRHKMEPSYPSFRGEIKQMEDEIFELLRRYKKLYKQNVPIRIARYR